MTTQQNDQTTVPQFVDAATMRALLDLSPAALTALKQRGIVQHVGKDRYDFPSSLRAYVRHLRSVAAGRGGEEEGKALATERARLARGQADAMELKNGLLRGELIRADDAERTWTGFLSQVRSRILAVPARLRQRIGMSGTDALELDKELREALTELGST